MNLDEVSPPEDDGGRRLRILMLADDGHVANVVQDHINSIVELSQHEIIVINPINNQPHKHLSLLKFDGILIHYSIYILGQYYLSEAWIDVIAAFPGFKAQIIQDEHRLVNAMKERMAFLGISVIFSSLEPSIAEKVYGGAPLNSVTVISCLPGYVDDHYFNISAPPIAERRIDIVYRGRSLTPALGAHAQCKRRIGEQVYAAARLSGLKVDISSSEESRIYGDAWMMFLGSGRATLGVEGGASIFDFTGEVARLVAEFQQEYPEADFRTIWEAVLRRYEGNIVHRTLTPKIFEAIATKTALILYPGKYRGVLFPGVHYIELKEDGSNIDEVFQRLCDTEYLQAMVDRTHDEILYQERNTFRYFVQRVDWILQQLNFSHKRDVIGFALYSIGHLTIFMYRYGKIQFHSFVRKLLGKIS